MNILTKKNPKLKKVFKEYKEYSSNPKNKNLLEARKKSMLVMKTNLYVAKQEGINEGIEKRKVRDCNSIPQFRNVPRTSK